MSDIEQRLHSVVGGMAGNESLAASLDEDAAGELLSWGSAIAKRIVDETDGMDDDTAEEHMSPRLRALRLMMRMIGRWAGEADSLDVESRLALWNRASEQIPVLFGETLTFPSMDEALAHIPADASARQMIAWLRTFIDEKGTEG
jgi:hypothetical protein